MSSLRQVADDYLRLRQSLGHKLHEAVRLLPRFVAYLEEVGAETVTIEAALAWAQQPEADPSSVVWARRMQVARGFARYLAGIDPRTEVPPAGLLLHRPRRRVPHLYSAAEITALMAQVPRTIASPPLRAATYQTLIGLLAVTGMRVGEAIRLDRADVDWGEGVITILATKFNKSRAVPVQDSTMRALAAYARQRDQLQPAPKSPSFFLSSAGTRLFYEVVHPTFVKLLAAAGIGAGSLVRPRIHDLRHSFTVRTVLEWHRSGVDVEARLPWLSTYLGHRNPRSTYRYLSASPELLGLAASRLDAAWEVGS
jgi:integrase